MPAQTAQSGVVHFSIEPAFIAEKVRDCVQSQDWRHADRILCSLTDLEGNPPAEHHRHAVAAGTMTLDGPMNEPAFVDWTEDFHPVTWTADRGWDAEDTQEEDRLAHLKSVRWLYSGICRTGGGKLWRPYAIVSGANEDCARAASEETGITVIPTYGQTEVYRRWARARASHWKGHGDHITFHAKSARHDWHGRTEEVAVLWRRAEDPPIWATLHRTFEAALADFAGSFEARGPGRDMTPVDLDLDRDLDNDDYASAEDMAAEVDARLQRQGADVRGALFDDAKPSLEQMQVTQALSRLRPDLGPDPLRAFLDRSAAESAIEAADVDPDASPAQQTMQRAMGRRKRVLGLKRGVEEQAEGQEAVTLCWNSVEGTSLTCTVPRALFAAYAVFGLRASMQSGVELVLADARALWPPVCPVGMKSGADDAWHSDLVLACGFDLDTEFGRGLDEEGILWMSAVQKLRGKLQEHYRRGALDAWVAGGETLTNAPGTVLCGGGTVTGTVVMPAPDEEVPAGSIVVVPHAGPEYYIAAVTAHREGGGAVIAEHGGQLAHLAVVGREEGFRVLVIEDALDRFTSGDTITVNMATACASETP